VSEKCRKRQLAGSLLYVMSGSEGRRSQQCDLLTRHLVQNLAAVLETVFTMHVAELRTVDQATLDADLGQAVRPGPSR
jgi:hypothetical protein